MPAERRRSRSFPQLILEQTIIVPGKTVSTHATTSPDACGCRRLRIAVVPFGCKVSRIEAQALAGALSSTGRPVPGDADVVVLHGCAVTDRAERDQRRFLRHVRRENVRATLVVTGCLAARDPEALARLPEVDLVVGADRLSELPHLLEERDAGLLPGKIVPSASDRSRGVFAAAFPDGERTRAFLKIQDGCGRRCAFCIVPSLRGPERSAEPSDVEREIRRLGAAGVAEVVLAGVHLANFGRERGTDLLALLSSLESDPPGCRIRLSSLEPMEAGEALVDFVAASRTVVPHLHLPLQSGAGTVLRRMRRGITPARFRALALRAVRRNPRLHLATDLIAGFPGETDAEFEETVRFVEELPVASLHVFPFSPRRGTRGAELHASSPVPDAAVTRRAARLRRLGEEKARAFRQAASGSVADAVALRGGVVLTDHYLEAALAASRPPGERLRVRLEAEGPAAALKAVPEGEAGSIPPP